MLISETGSESRVNFCAVTLNAPSDNSYTVRGLKFQVFEEPW